MLKAKVCKTFILLALLFCLLPTAMADDFMPIELNGEESYAMNLFLSNFTEVGVEKVDTFAYRDALTDFAHDHMWFNDYEAYEYGEYAGDNNCRVSDDRIPEIINDFFYCTDVDEEILSQTRYDYDGEYYYHCETGGWSNSGFAHTISLCPIGNNRYFASFMVFGSGEPWENDVLDDGLNEIIENYGPPFSYGSALVYAENLVDRGSYKMISYSRM